MDIAIAGASLESWHNALAITPLAWQEAVWENDDEERKLRCKLTGESWKMDADPYAYEKLPNQDRNQEMRRQQRRRAEEEAQQRYWSYLHHL